MATEFTEALCAAIKAAAADESLAPEVKMQIADDLLGMIELVAPEGDDLHQDILDDLEEDDPNAKPTPGRAVGVEEDASRESVDRLLGRPGPKARAAALRESFRQAADLDALLKRIDAPDPRPKEKRSVVPPRVEDLLRD